MLLFNILLDNFTVLCMLPLQKPPESELQRAKYNNHTQDLKKNKNKKQISDLQNRLPSTRSNFILRTVHININNLLQSLYL